MLYLFIAVWLLSSKNILKFISCSGLRLFLFIGRHRNMKFLLFLFVVFFIPLNLHVSILPNYWLESLSLINTLFFVDDWVSFDCGGHIILNCVHSTSSPFVNVPLLSRGWWVEDDIRLKLFWRAHILVRGKILLTAIVLNKLLTHI